MACDVDLLRLNPAAVDFERDVDARHRLAAVIRDAGGDGDALLVGERRALERDRRHRQIRRLGVADRDRRQDRSIRQADVVRPAPAAALKVGDQHDLAARKRRFRQDAARELERRTVVRGARGKLRGSQRRLQPALVRCRAQRHVRRRSEEDERRAIAAAERVRRVTRRRQRARPPIAIAHAVGPIDEDHDLARAARGCRRRIRAAKERPPEREHDQRQRRQPHHQQHPVTNPPPPNRLIRNPPQEHQRRELDDVLAFALNQVQEDRNGESGKGDEKQGSQERHHRTLASRSRELR